MTRSEEDGGEIWCVPVQDMLRHWDPFAAWCEDRIGLDEIAAAIAADMLDPRPFDTVSLASPAHDLRRYHVARIAWLVINPDAAPIEIDVGAPSLGWHPRREPFDFLDGNHRLCAAAFRRDQHILLTYGGECDAIPLLFPRAWLHSGADDDL